MTNFAPMLVLVNVELSPMTLNKFFSDIGKIDMYITKKALI